MLKNLFIQVAAGGNFPYVGWTAFANFCVKAGIPDKKGCPLATVDRVFIVVDQTPEEPVAGFLGKNLMRF